MPKLPEVFRIPNSILNDSRYLHKTPSNKKTTSSGNEIPALLQNSKQLIAQECNQRNNHQKQKHILPHLLHNNMKAQFFSSRKRRKSPLRSSGISWCQNWHGTKIAPLLNSTPCFPKFTSIYLGIRSK
ncbi:hypothetical protein CDAR_93061 [Caerostris darwini]|uniref:Uncharacterized protein n=1 Tax=Caerostris darwini TaxID=1538125 RepID=A0AAV4WHT3_9ARAC|nr:hypothetical protein CDAR_93061 [Caerostris darwini]